MKTLTMLSVFLVGCVSVPPSAEVRREDMLYTVGRIAIIEDVSVNHHEQYNIVGSGSAVVIESEDGITKLLTAEHVVAVVDEKPNLLMMVQFVNDKTVYRAKVLKSSKKSDLALIAIKAKKKYAAHYHFPAVKLPRLEEVWAVGSGAGAPINATIGYSGITHENGYMEFSAAVVGGNSGGGLFSAHNGHFDLVGIVSELRQTPVKTLPTWLMTADPATRIIIPELVQLTVITPIYHLGRAVALQEIEKFLRS